MDRARTRTRRACAAAAMAATAILLAACTSSTGGSGGSGGSGTSAGVSSGAPAPSGTEDSVAAMLALLPPSEEDSGEVISVTRWHAAAAAYGIAIPGAGATDDEVLDYLTALTTGDGGLSSVSDLMGVRVAAAESTRDQFGYLRQSIAAEATAGSPPRVVQAARGDFDPAAISAATGAGPVGPDVEQTEVDGVPVLRWRDDFAVDITRTSALSRIGSAGRLALPDDQTLLYTTYDDGIAGLIGAQQGGDSRADDADVAAVAGALDDQEALSALITAQPGGDGSATDGLEYSVAGIGFAWDGAGRVILAYSTDSAGDAETLAGQLETLVTTGRTLAGNQPWSGLLADPRIEVDGSVVTGTFAVQGPGARWAAYLYNRENLF